MTDLIVWFVCGPAVGLVSGWWFTRRADRRRRRREREHEMRFRLLDENGIAWIDCTCHDFALQYRYGFPREPGAEPEWATIEQVGQFRWVMRPAAADLPRLAQID